MGRSHISPYHQQANGEVERHNRVLGISLRVLLLLLGQEEWDESSLHLIRVDWGTLHTTTHNTALIDDRELQLSDQ